MLARFAQLESEQPGKWADRMFRCIIFNLWRNPQTDLEKQIAEAFIDYRDVILEAESPKYHGGPRNTNYPFAEEDFSPERRIPNPNYKRKGIWDH